MKRKTLADPRHTTRKRQRRRGTARLFVLGALAASATVSGRFITPTYAAGLPQTAPTVTSTENRTVLPFNIQPG